jgi:hypothetical protein
MRIREKFAMLSALALVVSCLWLAGGNGTSAQDPRPSAKDHFLQVGGIYKFEPVGGEGITCKVIDLSRGNWIQLRDEKDRKLLWLSLDHVAIIETQDQLVK